MTAERWANIIVFALTAAVVAVFVVTDHLDAQVALGFLVGGVLPSPNLTISSAAKAHDDKNKS